MLSGKSMSSCSEENNQRSKLLSGGGYSRDRIQYVDALKGFGILCVVLGHITVGYLDQNTFPEFHALLFTIRNAIYMFHMPLFMMISGYVFSVAYSNEKGVVDRKRAYKQAGNLIAVYVIWSMLTGFPKILLSPFVNRKTSISGILLTPVKPLLHLWYIYVLIFFYFIFSVELWNHLNKWKALGICAATCIIGNYISISWISFSNLLYYSLFFYIGIAYKKNKKWIIGNPQMTLAAFVVAMLLGMLCWDKRQEIYINDIPIVKILASLGISLAFWYVFEHVEFLAKNNFFRFCGRYSLEIYVIHNFFTGASRQLPKLGFTNIYLVILIAFTAGVIVPVVFSVLCRKMNIYGFFFKPLSYFEGRKQTE